MKMGHEKRYLLLRQISDGRNIKGQTFCVDPLEDVDSALHVSGDF